MIRYSLVCDHRHDFEIWFNNSADYDKQVKRKLVNCPICNSSKVEKAIMTPSIGKKSNRRTQIAEIAEPQAAPEAVAAAPENAPVPMLSSQEQELRGKLKELRDHLTKNSDNVGKKFPEEARKMHYGEVEHRSIFGEATSEEAQGMLEEGIEFHPLPILPEDRN